MEAFSMGDTQPLRYSANTIYGYLMLVILPQTSDRIQKGVCYVGIGIVQSYRVGESDDKGEKGERKSTQVVINRGSVVPTRHY